MLHVLTYVGFRRCKRRRCTQNTSQVPATLQALQILGLPSAAGEAEERSLQTQRTLSRGFYWKSSTARGKSLLRNHSQPLLATRKDLCEISTEGTGSHRGITNCTEAMTCPAHHPAETGDSMDRKEINSLYIYQILLPGPFRELPVLGCT